MTRFREDTSEMQAQAAKAVREWREASPDGTVTEMLEAIGGDFDPDYATVLRALLYKADPPAVPAGVTAITRDNR